MATSAVARETIASLRRTIAGIEGRLAERLEVADESRMPPGVVRRLDGAVSTQQALLSTGAAPFDEALGGGLQADGLTEIHTAESRNAACAAGFALALCARLPSAAPVLWIGTTEIFHEAGLPYTAGIASGFGVAAERLLVAQGRRVEDALWIAGEAAALPDLAAVIIELRGSPEKLGLTATRGLQRRASLAGRPVFLLRQAGMPQPTAARTRLLIEPAPALPRETLGGPLAGTIGRAVFSVTIAKNRLAPARCFTLEWNSHERSFGYVGHHAGAQDTGTLVAQSRGAAGAPAAAGALLAFSAGGASAPRHKPYGSQFATDRGHRRAG